MAVLLSHAASAKRRFNRASWQPIPARLGLSAANTDVYVSGSQMTDELTDGTSQTTDNSIAGDNSYDLQIFGGNLYESASDTVTPANADGSIDQVGSGLPTSGPATDTALITGIGTANALDTTHFSPEQFIVLNAGTGGAVGTIYVADSYSKAGASGSNGAIEKYTCTSGCTSASGWTARGYVVLPFPTGLTAEETSSGVQIFATGGIGGTSGSHLYSILDASCSSSSSSSSCATTTLQSEVSSATSIATAPAPSRTGLITCTTSGWWRSSARESAGPGSATRLGG